MAAPEIRGFTVVRKLGEGTRAEVFLARLDQALPEVGAQTVVIKLYRESIAQPDWMTEVEALERAEGTHVVALLDIAQTASGRTAIMLERLEPGSLGRLLRQRSSISVGEAITISAPVVETIDRLHAAGVVHGALSTEAVMFSQLGAPTLARFGAAMLVDPGMPPARKAANQHLERDLSATITLVSTVFDRVGHERDVLAFRDWLGSCTRAGSPALLPALRARLFDLGEPEAVRQIGADDLQSTSPATNHDAALDLRARVISAPIPLDGPALDVDTELSPQATAAFVMPTWLRTQLGRWLAAIPGSGARLESVTTRIPAVFTERIVRLRRSLLTVRPRVWVLAAAVAIAMVTVAVLTAPVAEPRAAESGVADPQGSGAADESPTGSTQSQPAGAPGSSAGQSAESPTPDDGATAAIESDDPLRALAALVRARHGCFRDLSVLCLDAVAQFGSAALEEDQALILATQAGGESPTLWSIDMQQLTIVERLGDSALISTGQRSDGGPGSILVMKGTEGWRIRDYLP